MRQSLIQFDAWPEAGDQFLALMPQWSWRAPQPTEQDYRLLPVVAQDVIAGFDIGANYPAFFQKLLCDSDLRQVFLDELQGQSDNA